MPRYFMRDTRLAALERMMMDPSRTATICNADIRRQRPQKKQTRSQAIKQNSREWEIKEGSL